MFDTLLTSFQALWDADMMDGWMEHSVTETQKIFTDINEKISNCAFGDC